MTLQQNFNVHILVGIYSVLLISSFAFSIGWTGVGLDDPPNVGRQKWMQQSNSAIRMATLILASIAGLISIIFMVNIFSQKGPGIHMILPLIFMTAAALGIANAVVDRPKRGNALGITTMTVNGIALVAILYYMIMYYSGIQKNQGFLA